MLLLAALTACGRETKTQEKESQTQQEVRSDNPEENMESGSDGQEKESAFDQETWAAAEAEKRTAVSFVKMNESYLEGVMQIDLTKVSKNAVYVDASGSTIDEFGIFQAIDGDTAAVQKMVQEYLDGRLAAWMEEYMPEEKPKVQKASLQVKEGYVLYAILGEKDKEQLFESFEKAVS